MKDLFLQLLRNDILIASVVSNTLAQLLKLILSYAAEKKIDWKILWSTGGNPSSHTSTVTTLTILLGARFGFDSPYFAISFVISSIVIIDALSVRREVGKHAKTMNEIFRETLLGKRLKEIIDIETFKELIGHTGSEVFMGFLVGTLIAALDLIIVK